MTTQKTTIDYLRFRAQEEPRNVLQALRPMFGTLGHQLAFKHLPRGSMGFQQASQVVIGDMPIARLDFGGESQRGWVRTELTGKGCEWVQDWDAVQELEDLPSAQIRRLDIALTTWDGQVTHERVVKAHSQGRFSCGGRPPDLQQITSSNDRAGRTCYVGKRTSEKFFRAYEKGFEEEYNMLCSIERLAPDIFAEEKGSSKPVCANVDLFSGLIYNMLGISEDIYTPLFAIARVPGWCAHRVEEVIFANRIIRPAYKYLGVRQKYKPIEER